MGQAKRTPPAEIGDDVVAQKPSVASGSLLGIMVSTLQPSFDDLGTPLSEVTFVVVDLETTGGSTEDQITEIGAVKVRGGEVIGEFQTLVNPHGHIPPLIAVLTGITDAMVADAPRIEQVLGSFLSFLGDAVLVAHNARFDAGFLQRACATHAQQWPHPIIVDTVALARQALLRDEVPNVKLGTLAAHFGTTVTPNHRALSDARATVDVLHALLERVGNLGVATLEDLREFGHRVSPQRRAKRAWAKDLPDRPGVYCFVADSPDQPRQVLYVGKSVNLRRRVATYFTASEKRPRMEEMIRVATGVEATVCRTPLEADVTELRLIAAHAPRYNRRSKFPQRVQWIKLTNEAFPRLSLVREVKDDAAVYFGPFASRAVADEVLLALYEAHPIRQCTQRMPVGRPAPSCALAQLGRCVAPCTQAITPEAYADVVAQLVASLTHDVRPVLSAARPRLGRLAAQERFEEAASLRTRLEAYTRAAVRHHRVASLAAVPEIVAARRTEVAGNAGSLVQAWEIHVIRHGRLVAADVALPGDSPRAVATQARSLAETVLPPVGPAPAATIEETERIADWLEQEGVRFLEIEGDWVWPLHIGLTPEAFTRHLTAAGPVALGA